MSIKIAVALEVADEESRDRLLKGIRRLLLAEFKATPKYKVSVKYEAGNEEIGDGFPLDLEALGVEADDSSLEPLPLEQWANSLERGE